MDKAERLQKEGYATFMVVVVEAKNISGGTVTVKGIKPCGEGYAEEVVLPTGVVGNLDDCLEYVGCAIDIAVLATYANGNDNLVPYAYPDDVKHFDLVCTTVTR